MKICFFGTSEFAVPTLKKIAKKYEIVGVYTRKPKSHGRKQEIQKTPVHILAEEIGLPVFCPENIKTLSAQEEYKNLNMDITIVASYGKILPSFFLNYPKYGCINIHGSLLPRWRGASPVQHAIMAGDKKTGVTIMYMDEGVDTGDIITMEETEILDSDDSSSLLNRLGNMGGDLLLQTLENVCLGKIERTKQDNNKATLAPMIIKEDGKIDFNKTTKEIINQIRALNPWPGTFFYYRGEKINVKSVEEVNKKGDAGFILDNKFTIATQDGAIRLTMLQKQGKKLLSLNDFLNGFKFIVGEVVD